MTDGHSTDVHHDSHTPHHVWYFGVFACLCVLTMLSVLFDVFKIEGHTTIARD